MSRTFKMLISNWPRTRKFNGLLHLHAGKAISYCHALITLYVHWSKFDRWVGLCGVSLYTSNDLTYNSIRFKKPLDIFWPQIQRKGSEAYLVMILAVNRKLWAIFLPRVHLPASNINKLMLTWLMIFRDTLLSILLFVNENYCLCTCFTEL